MPVVTGFLLGVGLLNILKKPDTPFLSAALHAVDVGIDGHHVLFELGLGDFVAFVDFLLAEVVQRELRLDFRMAGAGDGFSCGGSVSMFISFQGMSYFRNVLIYTTARFIPWRERLAYSSDFIGCR